MTSGNASTVIPFGTDVADAIDSFGPLTSYTPTIGGAFTLGNGTSSGWYTRIEKFVLWRATFTFGSTSSAGTGGCQFSLPVTASSNESEHLVTGTFKITTRYVASGYYNATTTAILYVTGTNGLFTNCTTSVPASWTTGSSVQARGWYEAA